MTSRDDRFLEMLTDSQFDEAIELMLRGIVVEPQLEPVARFADEAGALADASPPPASPELAALLAGEPLADDLLPVGATRATAIARTCLPERGSSRRSGGGVVARKSAGVAAMSLATKAGLGLALAGAGAAGAGAAGVLPESVVDAVRHTIEVVTPFELPDQAFAGATTPAAEGSTAEATGSRAAASDGGEPPVSEPTGSDAGTEGPPGASDTPRPGGGTGPTAESPAPVDPPATVPPLDDTPSLPASSPGHEQPPRDPADAPHPAGPPSPPGHANPDPGGLANEERNPDPDHSPTPNAGGVPSQVGGADVGGPPSHPAVAGADSPPNEAANPAGPASQAGVADVGGPPPVPAGTAAPRGAALGSASAPDLGTGRPPSGFTGGDLGGIVDGPEPARNRV